MILNGKLMTEEHVNISPNNRSFRYGDGCFETMKIINGKISLADEHFERLFTSLELLQFDKPKQLTANALKEQIVLLATKNNHQKLGRIRLTFFRSDGGLYDPQNMLPNYIIQTWDLNAANNELNENGLVIDIYTDARKVCDRYSPIKSNNYLSYAMAALWAKKNHLNDALLLNPYDRIADATIANIWMIKDGIIKTPSLQEGCVNGVMRKHLLKCLRAEGIPVEETGITVDELLNAQELFVTNAIYGIKWIRQVGNSNYILHTAAILHKNFIKPLWL